VGVQERVSHNQNCGKEGNKAWNGQKKANSLNDGPVS